MLQTSWRTTLLLCHLTNLCCTLTLPIEIRSPLLWQSGLHYPEVWWRFTRFNMTRGKHTAESAKRIERSHPGVSASYQTPMLRIYKKWLWRLTSCTQSRQARSALRAAERNQNKDNAGNGSKSSEANTPRCERLNRSGGRCNGWEPCDFHTAKTT